MDPVFAIRIDLPVSRWHGWLSRCLAGLLLIWLSSEVAADTAWAPRIDRLTVAEGLPDQTLFSVQSDPRGFLWMGTTAGAVRYDGQRFLTLRHNPDDPHSISHDNASLVRFDRRGRLWVGTWGGGLNRVDLESGEVTRWAFDPADAHSLASNFVQALHEDGQGRLWVGTGAGLMRVQGDRSERIWVDRPTATALSSRRIWAIAESSDGRIWAATSSGLLELAPDGAVLQLHLPPMPHGGSAEMVRLVLVDDRDRLWLANDIAFGRYDPPSGQFLPVQMPALLRQHRLTVNCALRHDARRLWLGTWAGVFMLDSDTAELVTIGRSGEHQLFPSDDVRGLHVDGSGVLWAATRFNGLARIELSAPRLRLYRRELGASGEGDYSSQVRAIYPGGGALWLNTDGAMIRADLDRGRFESIAATRGLRVGRGGPSAFDDRGQIWLATLYGPARLDPSSGQLSLHETLLREAGVADSNLSFVRRDSRNRLWWATQREGVVVSDLDARLLRVYPGQRGTLDALPAPDASCLLEDRQGRIWLCTDAGLARLRADESGFEVFEHAEDDPQTLSHNRVISLLQDSQGRLWIGTQVGLDRWNESSQAIERFASASGERLPVEALVEGRAGELWIASAGRLHRFDVARESFVGTPVQSAESGLAFFIGAAHRIDGRRLLFGSNRGLLLFDPADDQIVPFSPPAAITAAWIDRQPLDLPAGTVLQRRLQLPAETRSLELQLAVLDLRDPAANRIAYRLEGFDDDWITSSPSSNPTYTNLAPGRYRFRARAAGVDRVWNEQAVDLEIEVLPPWWDDWRLHLLAVLVLLLTGYLWVRWYTRRVRLREAHLERVVEERSRLIARQQGQMAMQEKMASLGTLTAGVAHEINNPTNFAFVGAQNLDSKLDAFETDLRRLAGHDAEPEVLDFFAARFAELREQVAVIREGADRIRVIVGHLRSFTRHDESIGKVVSIDDGLRSTTALVATQYGDRVKLQLLLQPGETAPIDCHPAELNQVFMNLIVNACQAAVARHPGGGGEVAISSADTPTTIEVSIRDNGAGIAAEHLGRIFEPFFTTKVVGEGTGLGLSISYGIVESHGGRIEVESQPAVGTLMRVVLPRRTAAEARP